MGRIGTLLVLTLVLLGPDISPAQEISVKIKVKKPGLFGGEEKYLTISLSDKEGNTTGFTDEQLSVLGGRHFLCRGAKPWEADEKFFKKEIQKLIVEQGGKTYKIQAKQISKMSAGEGYECLVIFDRKLSFAREIVFVSKVDKEQVRASMKIPEQYWKGYSSNRRRWKQGERAAEQGRWDEAIRALFPLYEDPPPDRFSFYGSAMAHLDKACEICLIEPYRKGVQNFELGERSLEEQPKESVAFYEKAAEHFKAAEEAFRSVGITKGNLAQQKPKVSEAFKMLEGYRRQLVDIDQKVDTYARIKEERVLQWMKTARPEDPDYNAVLHRIALASGAIDFSLPYEQLRGSLQDVEVPDDATVSDKIAESAEALIDRRIRVLREGGTGFPEDFMADLRKNAPGLFQPYFFLFEAMDLFLHGEYDPALQRADEALLKAADDRIFFALGKLRMEILANKRAVPQEAKRLMRKGVVLISEGVYNAALDTVNAAMAVAPQYDHPLIWVARAYEKSGEIGLAEAYLELAVDRDPHNLLAHAELERIYREKEDVLQASNVSRDALVVIDSWWFRCRLGDALLAQRKLKRAVLEYSRSLRLNDKAPAPYIGIARAYLKLGDYEKAKAQLDQAASLQPGHQETQEMMALMARVKRVLIPPPQEGISFLNMAVKEGEDGLLLLVGEISNGSAKPAKTVNLIVRFYDKVGKELATGIGRISDLGAFETKPFQVEARVNYEKLDHYRPEVALVLR